MKIVFYCLSIMTIFSVINVILQRNPIYSLLYLIIFFLSVTCILFSLKLYSIGMIGLIIQTGAISVLFLFVIMLLNKEDSTYKKNKITGFLSLNKKQIFMFFTLLSELLFSIQNKDHTNIPIRKTEIRDIGFFLFDRYFLILELISILLLSSLIISCHYIKEKNDNFLPTIKK